MATQPPTRVAIAIVQKHDLWLVTLRDQNAHLGGCWEFPGGKCQPGEHAVDAALRELREETGLSARPTHVLSPCTWDYDDRVVHITPVVCAWQAGDAAPLACVACRWVTTPELRALAMPAANAEIIRTVLNATER